MFCTFLSYVTYIYYQDSSSSNKDHLSVILSIIELVQDLLKPSEFTRSFRTVLSIFSGTISVTRDSRFFHNNEIKL
jgi:hypothetical protein